jgi:hypothetical protein
MIVGNIHMTFPDLRAWGVYLAPASRNVRVVDAVCNADMTETIVDRRTGKIIRRL